MRISFNKYTPQYYVIHGWLNPDVEPQIQRADCKGKWRFLTALGVRRTLTPVLFKGQLYIYHPWTFIILFSCHLLGPSLILCWFLSLSSIFVIFSLGSYK